MWVNVVSLENSLNICAQAGLGSEKREEARNLVGRCFPGLGMSDEDMDRIVWCRVVMTLVGIMAFFFNVKGIFVSCFRYGLHFRTELLWIFQPT